MKHKPLRRQQVSSQAASPAGKSPSLRTSSQISKERKTSKERAKPGSHRVDPMTADSITRSRKVERIRKAIADGSYEVAASEVAGKVLDYMLGR